MATLQMPILNHTLNFDGGVYSSTMVAEMSLTNSKATGVIVMPYPTGTDIGLMGAFTLPQNYVGTPKVVIRCIIDGTPANVLAFGFQQICIDDNDSADVAYEAEDTASNSTWTGYADKDLYEEIIDITPTATYNPGDVVFWYLYRDDSVDTTTYNVLLIDLLFQYADV